MAIVIDQMLAATPAQTRLPSGPIELTQAVHSDLGGEVAQITYSLDGRNNVVFLTATGPSKTITVANVAIPAVATARTDTVSLGEIHGGTGLAQLEIDQRIVAENIVRDAVVIVILDDPA